MYFTIFLSLSALAVLIIGFGLIFNWFKPNKAVVKKQEGDKEVEKEEKAPLSSKEKWAVGAAMIALLATLLGLLFSYNPPWLEKFKAKNGAKA
jgi:p-aminobenzoyl-glutamate transporter AbgT